MRQAAAHLIGRHDFSAFRAAACQSHTAVRDLRRLNIRADGDRVEIDCVANAFLHHMVRNIVGSLVRVGRGEADPKWILRLLQDRDRRLAGMTAPACGLTLRGVRYPADSGVPPEGFAVSDD
jgi:tRNA pseudouridine38-40 synthase